MKLIMEIKDLAIFILLVALSLSCVGISYQIMRLLSAVTENLKDFKKVVKNLGTILDSFTEDQKLISEGIRSGLNAVKQVEQVIVMISKKIIKPITMIFGFLTSIGQTVESVKSRFGMGDKDN